MLKIGGPLAMLGIAWKAIDVLEREVRQLRRASARHSNLLSVLYSRLNLAPPPDDL